MKSSITFLIILAIIIPCVASAQSTTSQDYQFYQSLLREYSGAEYAIERLQADDSGFEERRRNEAWIKSDSLGVLEIFILGDLSAHVTFTPRNLEPYGDASFAELLRQADGFNVTEPNILELYFQYPQSTLYMSFRIPDNAWVKTAMIADWR